MKIEYIPTILQVLVTFVTLIASVNYIINKSGNVKIVFFTFALVCILLSGVYWITYDVLRYDVRMPFAANEIAEWAIFISLGKLLSTSLDIFHKSAVKEIIIAVLFVISNVYLWIRWTGEYIQDIITGIVIIYYIFHLMIFMKQNNPFSPVLLKIWAVLCFLIIILNIVSFYISDNLISIIDFWVFFILFVISIYILIVTLFLLNKHVHDHSCLSASFSLFIWSTLSMYMTSGYYYMIAMFFNIISVPIMFLSLQGREEHDIC